MATKEEKTTQEENFDHARELARENHEADVAAQPKVEDDKDVKTEIPTHPELKETKNPEQVKVKK